MKTNFKKWSQTKKVNMVALGVMIVSLSTVFVVELFK